MAFRYRYRQNLASGSAVGPRPGRGFCPMYFRLPSRRESHLQRRFFPKPENLLIEQIHLIVAQLHVKIPKHLGQYDSHLSISKTANVSAHVSIVIAPEQTHFLPIQFLAPCEKGW